MPLESKSVDIPLSAGLDEVGNPEANPNGFLTLADAEWREPDSIQPRHGFTSLASWTSYAAEKGLVTDGKAIAAINGNGTALVYKPGQSTPASTALLTAAHRSVTTTRFAGSVLTCDSAFVTVNGRVLGAVVIRDAATGANLNVRVFDYATDTTLYTAWLGMNSAALDGFNPRIVPDETGAKFYVFFLDESASPGLRVVTVDPVGSVSAATTLDATAINTTTLCGFDVVTVGGACYVAWNYSGNHFKVAKIVSGAVALETAEAGLTSLRFLAIAVMHSGTVAVVYQDATGFNGALYDAALSRVRLSDNMVASAGVTLNRVTAASSLTSDDLLVVAEVVTAGVSSLQVVNWTTTGTAVQPQVTIPRAVLVTKVSGVPTSEPSAAFAAGIAAIDAGATLSGGVTLVNPSTGVAIGTVAFDEAVEYYNMLGAERTGALSSVQWLTDLLVTTVPVELEAASALEQAANIVTQRRARTVEIDFGASVLGHTRICGQGLTAGSLPYVFDGAQFIAAASTWAPRALDAATTTGTLTGVYNYKVQLEYVDARGNLQYSPVSPTTAITLAAQGASLTLYPGPAVPGLSGGLPVATTRWRVYRTVAGGSTYFLNNTVAYSSGGDTFTDTTTDAVLAGCESLNQSDLESELAPPLLHVTTHKNRVWGVRSDDQRVLSYTTETSTPLFPRWNAVLTQRVDNQGGAVNAVASLDDKLLAFQDNQIVAITGDGPDATGANGAFSAPEIVARGVGVTLAQRASVVETPDGVMFRHSSGIFRLNRGLQLEPLGLAIQRELPASTNIVSARYLSSLHQAWFLLDAAPWILVFDTRWSRWATYTPPGGNGATPIDVVEADGVAYILTTLSGTARLWQYDTSTYTDSVYDYRPPAVVALPWFRPGQRQGQMRLWKLTVTGQTATPAGATLTADVYSQQDWKLNKASETRDARLTWTGSTQIDSLPDSSGFSLTGRAVTQRASAVKVVLTLTRTTDAIALKLTGISLEYGVEPAARGKNPSAKRPAAS